MNTDLSKFVYATLKTIESKNIDSILNIFHEDSVFIDPHYPNVHMKGKAQIREGFTWGMNGVESFQFTPINYFENKENTSASVEVATKLVLKNGKKLSYQQVFIIETKEGKISRCQAYETYGPHGVLNIMLTVTRLVNKLRSS